ncbi:MAG: hypothetical protein LBD24_01065 [Spirochaetaceae bacterium]|jgi:hypothetical protein|nr:hypothetical protein [Spirochaetaceae bacterium]
MASIIRVSKEVSTGVSHSIKGCAPLRRLLFIFALFALLASRAIYAQETPFSFGLGGEISGAADSKMYEGGGGFIGTAEYRFHERFAAGIKSGASNDFQYRITVFRENIFARWYFWQPKSIDVFAEAGLGGLLVVRGNETWGSLEAAFTLGARFSFGAWYVEPYIGAGYPVWGRVGVAVGIKP